MGENRQKNCTALADQDIRYKTMMLATWDGGESSALLLGYSSRDFFGLCDGVYDKRVVHEPANGLFCSKPSLDGPLRCSLPNDMFFDVMFLTHTIVGDSLAVRRSSASCLPVHIDTVSFSIVSVVNQFVPLFNLHTDRHRRVSCTGRRHTSTVGGRDTRFADWRWAAESLLKKSFECAVLSLHCVGTTPTLAMQHNQCALVLAKPAKCTPAFPVQARAINAGFMSFFPIWQFHFRDALYCTYLSSEPMPVTTRGSIPKVRRRSLNFVALSEAITNISRSLAQFASIRWYCWNIKRPGVSTCCVLLIEVCGNRRFRLTVHLLRSMRIQVSDWPRIVPVHTWRHRASTTTFQCTGVSCTFVCHCIPVEHVGEGSVMAFGTARDGWLSFSHTSTDCGSVTRKQSHPGRTSLYRCMPAHTGTPALR